MTAKKLAAALIGSRWDSTAPSTLSLSSTQKLGAFSVAAKLPAESGALDLGAMTVELVLRVDRLDTGNFLFNAPLRAVISSNLGSTARWFADSSDVSVTGSHSVHAAGEVQVGRSLMQIPADLVLELDEDMLYADFTAQYVFPHVKLGLPGVPEVYDFPVDLAGRLTLERVD